MGYTANLCGLMEKRGVSSYKLAKDVGVHVSTVTNWKDGKEVKAENLTALCTYFGCSLDYLAGKMEETKKAPTQKGERFDENTELSDVYFSLAKDLQEAQIDPVDVRNFAEIIKRNMKKLEEDHE